MQRSLFDTPDDGDDDQPRERRRKTIQERFEEFDMAHPDVYALFRRFAFELQNAGRMRYGAKSLIERIRWHLATSSNTEEFKINNNFTSRYVRKLVEECPQFAGFFERRRLQVQ